MQEENYKTDAEKDGQGGWGYNSDENKFEGRKPKYTWRDPGFEQNERHPVVNVSWNDAQAFCQWLKQKTGRRVNCPPKPSGIRPAGPPAKLGTSRVMTPESLEGYANVADAALKRKGIKGTEKWTYFAFDDGYAFTSPVGAFKPNPWGLHDMTGNVWQWCADRYGEKYYTSEDITDPTGPNNGDARVLRGGSWSYVPRNCRAARRLWGGPSSRNNNGGFRGGFSPGLICTVRFDTLTLCSFFPFFVCAAERRAAPKMGLSRLLTLIPDGTAIPCSTVQLGRGYPLSPHGQASSSGAARYPDWRSRRVRTPVSSSAGAGGSGEWKSCEENGVSARHETRQTSRLPNTE